MTNPQVSDNPAEAPVLPAEFWDTSDLQEAFRSRHFGHVLRAYRHAHEPVLQQDVLATWLGLSQGQISRIERSHIPITDLGKLSHWATVLHMPPKNLWFSLQQYGPSVTTSPILEQEQPEEEDVERRTLLKGIGLGASLLTISTAQVEPSQSLSSPQYALDKRDIAIIQEITKSFRRLDNKFGGGHAYSIVANYIVTNIEPTIKLRHYSETLRTPLFLAAVEMYQLAGWMAYDMGDSTNGYRHLRTALRLCEEVRSDALAAEMLAGISHQASFSRQANSAIELASAASYAARNTRIPKLQAETAVMEAHGLALRGEQRDCILALQRAEKHFMRDSNNSPDWLQYLDEAYLSAKFGHTLRDLGRPSDAERFARNSLRMTEGYERGRLFNTALLASVLADQGKVEEAVQHAHTAVQMSNNMRSLRTTKYLIDVHDRLLPYKDTDLVQSLYRSMKMAGVKAQSAIELRSDSTNSNPI